MGVARLSIGGSPFIGAFCIATDTFSLVGRDAGARHLSMIKDNLGVDAAKASIDGSSLIGVYAVANSKALLLPSITGDDEAREIARGLPGIRVERLKTDLNALGNNILANDSIALVNPEYSDAEIARIGSALGVEARRLEIGGFRTVGASNILTNKGMVMNNRASDAELDAVRPLVKGLSQSTANMGALIIRLSIVANSNGLLVGDETTGFEMARITDGLDL